MAPGGVEERETYFQMEGIQRMVSVYNEGPMDTDKMRQIMSLQLFDSSGLSDDILEERVKVAVTQPSNLFSTMMVPNMTNQLNEISIPCLGFWEPMTCSIHLLVRINFWIICLKQNSFY